MPRGRPRKVNPEILPPEDDQPKGRKKLVEAEHTIKYTSPVPVTVEDNPEDAELELLDDEDRPKKKKNNEREELRKVLAKNNITPATQLKLTIERYLHSETSEGGTWAETEHCTRYPCTKEHIISEDYLDAARKWGVGTYRFTLRMQHQIVTAWDKRISTGMPGQVVQHTIPGDPTSPQVIVSGDGQQPMSFRDIMRSQKEAFKEQLEMAKLMREAYGLTPETSQTPTDPEVAALHLLAKNPDVMEKVAAGIAKVALGSKSGDSDPWADVAIKVVESGQAPQMIRELISGLFNGFQTLIPPRANDGQAQQQSSQVDQAPIQNQASTDGAGNAGTSENMLLSGVQTRPGESSSRSDGDAFGASGQQQQITPEEQALQLVIDHCQKRLPPQIAFNRLMAFADAVNDQYPQGSIDGYIEMFGAMTPDQALEFVKTLPNGEAVIALDHTRGWTEDLQKLIRESQEGGEE